VFLASIFKHSDRNYLIFFGHFENVSVYDRKKTGSVAKKCTAGYVMKKYRSLKMPQQVK